MPESLTAAPEAAAPDSPGLEELQERFVLLWGEMASAWGINRTMGQIHGLLYISPEPLHAEEIMRRLQISRGNASMSLRALEDWGVVQRVHFTGDRREYYRSLSDVWALSRTVVSERKRREFDPLLRSLRDFHQQAAAAGASDPGLALYRERVGSMLEVLELAETVCERLLPQDPSELPRLLEVEVEGLS